MPGDEFEVGEYLIVRDLQRATQRIATRADLEEGMVVEVQQTRGPMLICDPIDLSEVDAGEEIEVQPFPASAGNPFTLQGGGVQESSESRLVEDDVAAEISEFLTESRNVESETRR